MCRVASLSCCPGVVGLLLLQAVLGVEGRSVLNPGNHVSSLREETNAQSEILSLLLHRSLAPVERSDPLGAELSSKLAELEELQALRENLELERAIAANDLMEGEPILRKRGEPCFWKYCV